MRLLPQFATLLPIPGLNLVSYLHSSNQIDKKFWTCEVKWTFEVSVNTEMDTRQWSFREQA